MRVAATKPKRCAACKSAFNPCRPLQVVCSPLCALEIGRAKTKKAWVKEAAQDRKLTREKLEAFKTIPELTKLAQTAFNAVVREIAKQAGYACISSGKPLDWSGNRVDAGHYRSIGAAPQLRFDIDNCHAQSKHDNRFLSGNAVDYRIGLIARIGIERVEILEANNGVHKWTRDELIAIKKCYVRKLKELKAVVA
jgi:hypothetical protein